MDLFKKKKRQPVCCEGILCNP